VNGDVIVNGSDTSSSTGRIYFSPTATSPKCKFEALNVSEHSLILLFFAILMLSTQVNGNLNAVRGRFMLYGGDANSLYVILSKLVLI
jgi:hypothetical protein